jgi:hypothetical protein
MENALQELKQGQVMLKLGKQSFLRHDPRNIFFYFKGRQQACEATPEQDSLS